MKVKQGAVTSTPVGARFDRGRHWRAKIGLVVLAMEQTVEDDAFTLTPPGVGLHFSRIPMSNDATVETLGAMAPDITSSASLLLPEDQLPERIRVRISEAANAHALALDALRAENLRDAMVQLLAGSDALREVGPEAVARTMVSEVVADRRNISARDSYSEQDLERLDRLLRGGREALSDQDWVRAIRRAYYARGLIVRDGA